MLSHMREAGELLWENRDRCPHFLIFAAQDIPEAQMQVFAFDWLTRDAPSPEMLNNTVTQRPANG